MRFSFSWLLLQYEAPKLVIGVSIIDDIRELMSQPFIFEQPIYIPNKIMSRVAGLLCTRIECYELYPVQFNNNVTKLTFN